MIKFIGATYGTRRLLVLTPTDYAKKMDSGKDNADDGDSCTSDAQCGVVGNYCAKDTCHDGSAGDQCDQDSDCERMGNYCQRDKDNIFADGACQRGLEGDRCQDGDHCVSCGECKKLTGIDLEGKKACTLKGHKPPGSTVDDIRTFHTCGVDIL